MAALVMAQDILEVVNQRIDRLRSLTDPARNDPPNRQYALDVKEGLQSFVLLRHYLVESLQLLFQEIIKNTADDYNAPGQMFLAASEAALHFSEAIRKRAWDVRAEGVPEDIRPQFDEAMQALEKAAAEVEKLKNEFAERWPWVDDAKLARSVSDERQGVRRHSAKEVFDELRRRVR